MAALSWALPRIAIAGVVVTVLWVTAGVIGRHRHKRHVKDLMAIADATREPRLPSLEQQAEDLDWLLCRTWDLEERIKLRQSFTYMEDYRDEAGL